MKDMKKTKILLFLLAIFIGGSVFVSGSGVKVVLADGTCGDMGYNDWRAMHHPNDEWYECLANGNANHVKLNNCMPSVERNIPYPQCKPKSQSQKKQSAKPPAPQEESKCKGREGKMINPFVRADCDTNIERYVKIEEWCDSRGRAYLKPGAVTTKKCNQPGQLSNNENLQNEPTCKDDFCLLNGKCYSTGSKTRDGKMRCNHGKWEKVKLKPKESGKSSDSQQCGSGGCLWGDRCYHPGDVVSSERKGIEREIGSKWECENGKWVPYKGKVPAHRRNIRHRRRIPVVIGIEIKDKRGTAISKATVALGGETKNAVGGRVIFHLSVRPSQLNEKVSALVAACGEPKTVPVSLINWNTVVVDCEDSEITHHRYEPYEPKINENKDNSGVDGADRAMLNHKGTGSDVEEKEKDNSQTFTMFPQEAESDTVKREMKIKKEEKEESQTPSIPEEKEGEVETGVKENVENPQKGTNNQEVSWTIRRPPAISISDSSKKEFTIKVDGGIYGCETPSLPTWKIDKCARKANVSVSLTICGVNKSINFKTSDATITVMDGKYTFSYDKCLNNNKVVLSVRANGKEINRAEDSVNLSSQTAVIHLEVESSERRTFVERVTDIFDVLANGGVVASGSTVEVYNQEGKLVIAKKTDAHGRVTLRLPVGIKYKIVVKAPGYEPIETFYQPTVPSVEYTATLKMKKGGVGVKRVPLQPKLNSYIWSLDRGWNLVALPFWATDTSLGKVIGKDVEVDMVATLEGGKWSVRTIKNNDPLKLRPGEAVFIHSLNSKEIKAPVKQMKKIKPDKVKKEMYSKPNQWQAVAIPYNFGRNSFQVLDNFTKGKVITLSSFYTEKGNWISSIKRNGEYYGVQFPIMIGRGYLIMFRGE